MRNTSFEKYPGILQAWYVLDLKIYICKGKLIVSMSSDKCPQRDAQLRR
jgi:hypothetical protein